MADTPSASASNNAITNLNLGNVPQVDDFQVYEALLVVHTAIEALATRLEDIDTGILVGLGDENAYIAAQLSVKTTAVSYLIQEGDGTVLTNTLTSHININLPSANGISGTEYTIKQVLGDLTTLVIPYGSDTIDGDTGTLVLYLDQSITLKSDGANWWIL